MKYYSYILIFFLLYYFSPAQPSKGNEKIVLHYADSLVGMTEGEGMMRKYEGNVRMQQGNVYVKCNTAIHYISQNKATLIGNVIITQDTMVLKSPRVDYDGNTGMADAQQGVTINDRKTNLTAKTGFYSTKTRIADFIGKVMIEDDSVVIFSDKVTYYRDTKMSLATGNTLIRGKFTNIILNGDTVLYRPNDKYLFVTGRPILMQIDTIRSSASGESASSTPSKLQFDTLMIVSDTMESFREARNERYYFKKNVEITRSKVAATSQLAEYYRAKSYMKLLGAPIIWYDSTQLYSDSTVIYLEKDKLKSIFAYNNAFAGTRDDSLNLDRINQIAGNTIQLFFEGDSIKLLLSTGEARSLYFMEGEEGPEGAARNGSDTIVINISEGKAEFIKWLGGVQGEYYPEHLIYNKIKEYFLPNYRWSETRPRKKQLRRVSY